MYSPVPNSVLFLISHLNSCQTVSFVLAASPFLWKGTQAFELKDDGNAGCTSALAGL